MPQKKLTFFPYAGKDRIKRVIPFFLFHLFCFSLFVFVPCVFLHVLHHFPKSFILFFQILSKKNRTHSAFWISKKKGPLPGGSSVFSSFSWFQYLCTIVKDKRKTIKRETFIGISSLFCKKEGSYDQRNEIIFILHFSQALKMCIKEYRGRESGNGPWRVWKEKIWYIFSQIII